ncbi:MAG: F0F1 ATP synthase subunit epsilon [Actinomycetota bacterium]|nr:F0F1 ATP synthase subunit epsilon [Actinomycetota bacterium]
MAENRLEVHVVTPEREVWTGEADMVVARAADGEVGILPGHAPYLAVLAPGPLRIKDGGNEERAAVDGGFLHVNDDRVDVLAEHALLASEIDAGRERSRREDLERRFREEPTDEVRVELAVVEARIRVVEPGS